MHKFKMKFKGARDDSVIRLLPSVNKDGAAYDDFPNLFIERRTNQCIDWIKELREQGYGVDANPGEAIIYEDDKEPVVKLRYFLNALRMHYVWVPAPCRPTKLEGRKGTKRAWKLANPPKWKAVPISDKPVVTISITGSVMNTLIKLHRAGRLDTGI